MKWKVFPLKWSPTSLIHRLRSVLWYSKFQIRSLKVDISVNTASSTVIKVSESWRKIITYHIRCKNLASIENPMYFNKFIIFSFHWKLGSVSWQKILDSKIFKISDNMDGSPVIRFKELSISQMRMYVYSFASTLSYLVSFCDKNECRPISGSHYFEILTDEMSMKTDFHYFHFLMQKFP